MSKIWKNPILLPEGVSASIASSILSVKGPKWELSLNLYPGITASIEENTIVLSCEDIETLSQYRGTMRSLAANMVEGVAQGYSKKLKVIGVGFDASLQGKLITLKLWYAHTLDFTLPEGVDAQVDKDPKGNAVITLSGIDKQLVGQTAAKLRALRTPEPYKGKGIRYIDEQVKLKPGKAAGGWKE